MAWALPAVDVRAIDFAIEWGLPSEGELGGMLTMTLRLVNHATTLRTLRLSFSENDAFLFCGMKLYHFQLPPGFSHTLTFNLVPIKSGAVQLPMPRLLCVTSNTELIDPSATHRVFVRPALPSAAWAAEAAEAAAAQQQQPA